MYTIDYCCQVIKMFHLFKKLVGENDREDVTRSVWFNLHDLVSGHIICLLKQLNIAAINYYFIFINRKQQRRQHGFVVFKTSLSE